LWSISPIRAEATSHQQRYYARTAARRSLAPEAAEHAAIIELGSDDEE
jgi:hypothetical protein